MWKVFTTITRVTKQVMKTPATSSKDFKQANGGVNNLTNTSSMYKLGLGLGRGYLPALMTLQRYSLKGLELCYLVLLFLFFYKMLKPYYFVDINKT